MLRFRLNKGHFNEVLLKWITTRFLFFSQLMIIKCEYELWKKKLSVLFNFILFFALFLCSSFASFTSNHVKLSSYKLQWSYGHFHEPILEFILKNKNVLSFADFSYWHFSSITDWMELGPIKNAQKSNGWTNEGKKQWEHKTNIHPKQMTFK